MEPRGNSSAVVGEVLTSSEDGSPGFLLRQCETPS